MGPKAFSMRAFCCWTCLARYPIAGDDEAGRATRSSRLPFPSMFVEMLTRQQPVPCALVAGLLLHPDVLFQLGKGRERRLERFRREGIELLEPNDRDVLDPFLSAIRGEFVIDLTRTEEYPFHLLRIEVFDLADHRLKAPLGEGLTRRRRFFQAQ